jgi:DNA-binding CsgD family transcriptional regulator
MVLNPQQTAEQATEYRQLERKYERQCWGAIFPPKVHQVESMEMFADWLETELLRLGRLKRLARLPMGIPDEEWLNELHDGSRKTVVLACGLAKTLGIKAKAPPTKEISRGDEFTHLFGLQRTVLAAMEGTATAQKVKGTSKRRRTAGERPLTELQKQSLDMLAKNNGRRVLAAREMGISHATFNQHLNAAYRKLPALAPKDAPAARRTKRLRPDRRGQADISVGT